MKYAEVEFEVPIGATGDNYDRYLVLQSEIGQSLSIVGQAAGALDALGPGPVDVDDPRIRWPSAADRAVGPEELIHHFKGVTDGPRVPPGTAYAAVESASGELGFLVVADGSARPQRVHCRAPAFFHRQALPAILVGAQLGDLGSTLDLVHAPGTEADR